MISKKIHYCWFGRNPLDKRSLYCIESWKKFFPEYEIIQWNEDNFDVQQNEFMRQAYADGKWAFVSDVARLIVVNKYGGIYFDTDVEVIKPFDDILEDSPDGFLGMDHQFYINTGLGFGAEKGNPLIEKLISIYNTLDYTEYKSQLSKIACPILTNAYLESLGIQIIDDIQDIMGITIYPSEYFNPLDYMTGRIKKSEKTHSIHWYGDSWNSEESRQAKSRMQRYRRIFGSKYGEILGGIISCMKEEGLISYLKKRMK